ncbi:C-X-C motif chemokine 11-like [Polypterus senegalus]|uniref:C-X-C motif chemokine 11-like n=1 Tax=Polypterus senegalus TaxID=55291 RepID=UPI001964B2E9|nr:C-X-C motif chemokine 11-like [Polypterus senegalus]
MLSKGTNLLMAVAVLCMTASAKDITHRSRCLCIDVSDKLVAPKEIKAIEILPPSSTCDNVEMIVRLKNEKSYCLDPKFKRLILKLKKRRT